MYRETNLIKSDDRKVSENPPHLGAPSLSIYLSLTTPGPRKISKTKIIVGTKTKKNKIETKIYHHGSSKGDETVIQAPHY